MRLFSYFVYVGFCGCIATILVHDILMAASPYFNFAALMIAVFVLVVGSPVNLVMGIGPNFGIIATIIYVGTSVISAKYDYDVYRKLQVTRKVSQIEMCNMLGYFIFIR